MWRGYLAFRLPFKVTVAVDGNGADDRQSYPPELVQLLHATLIDVP